VAQTAGVGRDCRKRTFDRARALAASTSRTRAGAVVTSESSSTVAARVTCSTARPKAASFAREGFANPLSLRTNCSEEARISSLVAGGLKLCSVLMFRHMAAPRAALARSGHVPEHQDRSEEHTSELQSRTNLVCRLLLEKKKKKHIHTRNTPT